MAVPLGVVKDRRKITTSQADVSTILDDETDRQSAFSSDLSISNKAILRKTFIGNLVGFIRFKRINFCAFNNSMP